MRNSFPRVGKKEASCQEISKMRDICIKRVSDLFKDVNKIISLNDIPKRNSKTLRF